MKYLDFVIGMSGAQKNGIEDYPHDPGLGDLADGRGTDQSRRNGFGSSSGQVGSF